MDDAATYRLLLLRGPTFPPVAREAENREPDDPIRIAIEEARAVEQGN